MGRHNLFLIFLLLIFVLMSNGIQSQDSEPYSISFEVSSKSYGFVNQTIPIYASIFVSGEANYTFNMNLILTINDTLLANESFNVTLTVNSTVGDNITSIKFSYQYETDTPGLYVVHGRLTYNTSDNNELSTINSYFWIVVGNKVSNGPIGLFDGEYHEYGLPDPSSNYSLKIYCTKQPNKELFKVTMILTINDYTTSVWFLVDKSDRSVYEFTGNEYYKSRYYFFRIPVNKISIYDLVPQTLEDYGMVVDIENITILNTTRLAYKLIISYGFDYEIAYYDYETGVLLKDNNYHGLTIELVDTNAFNTTTEEQPTNTTDGGMHEGILQELISGLKMNPTLIGSIIIVATVSIIAVFLIKRRR